MIETVELQGIIPQQTGIEGGPDKQSLQTGSSQGSFANMLTRAVNDVDQTMKDSEQQVQDFVAGKTDNVHDVMISMQRAQVSFQLMVEMRNKAVETYQEISRMPI